MMAPHCTLNKAITCVEGKRRWYSLLREDGIIHAFCSLQRKTQFLMLPYCLICTISHDSVCDWIHFLMLLLYFIAFYAYFSLWLTPVYIADTQEAHTPSSMVPLSMLPQDLVRSNDKRANRHVPADKSKFGKKSVSPTSRFRDSLSPEGHESDYEIRHHPHGRLVNAQCNGNGLDHGNLVTCPMRLLEEENHKFSFTVSFILQQNRWDGRNFRFFYLGSQNPTW
jgi:Ca2+/Na+ antiporter